MLFWNYHTYFPKLCSETDLTTPNVFEDRIYELGFLNRKILEEQNNKGWWTRESKNIDINWGKQNV